MAEDRVVEVASLHPDVEAARGLGGDLLITQIYETPEGVRRVVIVTEMKNALALAAAILRVADESFLNPVKPPLYDEMRKYLN